MGMKESMMKKMLKSKSKTMKVKVPKGEIELQKKWKEGKGSPLCPIPEITKSYIEEKEIYAIREPYSYCRIVYNNIESEFVYEIHEPELNPRFTLTLLRDTNIKPSPEWMQHRLKLIGQRPINNIVDVTNYITFELGQSTDPTATLWALGWEVAMPERELPR